jgi:chemotaxis response regulator CheB
MTERRLNNEDTNIIYFNFSNSADFRFIVVARTTNTETASVGTTGAGDTAAKSKY